MVLRKRYAKPALQQLWSKAHNRRFFVSARDSTQHSRRATYAMREDSLGGLCLYILDGHLERKHAAVVLQLTQQRYQPCLSNTAVGT